MTKVVGSTKFVDVSVWTEPVSLSLAARVDEKYDNFWSKHLGIMLENNLNKSQIQLGCVSCEDEQQEKNLFHFTGVKKYHSYFVIFGFDLNKTKPFFSRLQTSE